MVWIRRSSGWRFVDLKDLWAHRELVLYFAWRDVKVRYKQTLIGIGWVLIQPILQAAIFSAVFGRIAGLGSEGIPYSLFALSGLVPWLYFASTISKMATSLDGNMQLITKVYFPRAALPVSVLLGTLVDLVVALPVVLLLAAYLGVPLTGNLAALPLVILLLMGVALGAGLWLSALNARYRDVSIALPFAIMLMFYLTPVVFTTSVVETILGEGWLLTLWTLNPMLGVVEAFRWAALGVEAVSVDHVAASAGVALALIVSGGFFFSRTERTLIDRI